MSISQPCSPSPRFQLLQLPLASCSSTTDAALGVALGSGLPGGRRLLCASTLLAAGEAAPKRFRSRPELDLEMALFRAGEVGSEVLELDEGSSTLLEGAAEGGMVRREGVGVSVMVVVVVLMRARWRMWAQFFKPCKC